jgi:hypothetical protein
MRALTLAERTKIRALVEKAYKAVKAERSRRWRAANPEKSRESSKRWRDANKGEHRISNRLWRACNREKARATQAAWKARNPNYHKEWKERMKAAGHFKKGGKYYYPRTSMKEGR